MTPLKTQNPHSFKFEISKHDHGATSFGGIPFVRKALSDLGLVQKMREVFYLKGYLKHGGFEDCVLLEAVILLLASGGRCLSDWEYMSSDPGFAKMFGECPSVDAIERYLKRLVVTILPHGSNQGVRGYSTLLEILHRELIVQVYELAGRPTSLTIDSDTSLFATNKSDALFCYEGDKAYQPMIAYCPELGVVLCHEFRDGNVSPQLGYADLVSRCRLLLPQVREWTVRADSAGYNLKWLNQMTTDKIKYFVTADQFEGMTKILHSEKSWQRYITKDNVQTTQEVAEIGYIPTFSAQRELEERRHNMRFIAIRKPKTKQLELGEHPYIYQVLVTNSNESNLNKIIHEHFGRCGSVEYAHSQLKSGVGQRRFPSKHFHVNAAWFSLGIFTHNLLRLIQSHILPEKLKNIEIETLRYRFIRSVALIKRKARQTVVRFMKNHPLHEIYEHALKKLDEAIYKLFAAPA
jgi:hypothetical protein